MLTPPSLHRYRLSAIQPSFCRSGVYVLTPAGAVELAFDHHNGDVIMKTNVAAEVCRAVKDIDRQLFRP